MENADNLLKNAHKFQKISYSGIIPFVCEGKEEIHKYMQCKISMNVCMGRIANQGSHFSALTKFQDFMQNSRYNFLFF